MYLSIDKISPREQEVDNAHAIRPENGRLEDTARNQEVGV